LISLTLFPAPGASAAPTYDIHNILNWVDLRAACEDSDGVHGVNITLGKAFNTSLYDQHIDFSGKSCTIYWNGTIFDAPQRVIGRGYFTLISRIWQLAATLCLKYTGLPSRMGISFRRAEQSMPTVQMSRSIPALSRATALTR
jgi:hypothetical protein